MVLLNALYCSIRRWMKAAAGAGFDIFNGEKGTNSSLSCAIQGASEETTSMLSGYANAIRINQIKSMNILRSQLMTLDKIASNTSYNKFLESIDNRLASMASNNTLRSQGLGN